MKIRVLFGICLLWMLSFSFGRACREPITYNFYMYSIIEDNEEVFNKQRTDQLSKVWSSYVGKSVSSAEVEELTHLDPAAMDTSQNVIIATARQRNDKEMMAYLRLLLDYMAQTPAYSNDWYYGTEEEVAASISKMNDIAERAATYKGNRLFDQYALLQMRSLYHARKYSDAIAAWKIKGIKMKENVFKQMAKGFYAGALYRTGQREDACEVYAELGDIHSATWCMKDKRNLGCIKRVYASAPNSRTLQLLVQDFVNNAQETLDIRGLDSFEQELKKGREISNKVYRKEVDGFIAFAEQVVNERKCSTPCMWYSAAALLNFYYGKIAKARTLIDKAMVAEGNSNMKDNARIIRLLISTAEKQRDENAYEAFLIDELNWLNQKVNYNKEKDDYNMAWRAIIRIYRKHLIPRYEKLGRSFTANLLMIMAEDMDYRERYNSVNYDINPLFINYSSNYMTRLRALTPEQLKAIYKYFFSTPHKGLDLWLFNKLDKRYKNEEIYYDLIGTRYMKEGKFVEALPWLELVSTDFLSAQNISFYMAQRDYNVSCWVDRRQTIPSQFYYGGNEEPMKLTRNQKIDFCKDVIALESAVANKKATFDDYVRLANLYYQVSYDGACWYLIDYLHACSWYIDDEIHDIKNPKKDPFVEKAYATLQKGVYSTNDGQLMKEMIRKYLVSKDVNCLMENMSMMQSKTYALYLYNNPKVLEEVSKCDVLIKRLKV